MAKPGYIKVTKIWKKVFSDKEIKEIWDLFKHVSDITRNTEINWRETSYKDIVYGRQNNPVIPETDKYDGTEGVTPKQMEKLLNALGMEGCKNLFIALSKKSDNICNMRDSERDSFFDHEENTISWKWVIKDRIIRQENMAVAAGKLIKELYYNRGTFPISDEVLENLGKGIPSYKVFKTLSTVENGFSYKVSQDFIKGVLSGEVTEEEIDIIKKEKPFKKGTIIDMNNYSPEKFFTEQKEKWKKLQGFVPQDKSVLVLNPKYWNKELFLSSMDRMFGVKQIKRLNENDKDFFIKLYKLFGVNLLKVIPFIKLDKLKTVSSTWHVNLYEKSTEANDILMKIIEDSKKGIDIMLTTDQLYHILVTTSLINKGIESLEKKDRFTIRDIDALIDAGRMLNQKSSEGMDLFGEITFQDIAWLKKADIQDQTMNRLIKLFTETKNKKVKDIPILSKKVGEYEYEVLQKNDIRGLIVGNLSHCCQKIGGIGNDCVYYGARNENSTFFIVTKDGTLIAQSWVWYKNGQITFDSVECVSHAYGAGVMECYKDYAKQAIKENGIEKITIGAYGRTGLYNLFPLCNNVEHVDIYSDARTQYCIESK